MHSVGELRRYEADRHEELKRVAIAGDERPFRITLRMIRAWDRVRNFGLARPVVPNLPDLPHSPVCSGRCPAGSVTQICFAGLPLKAVSVSGMLPIHSPTGSLQRVRTATCEKKEQRSLHAPRSSITSEMVAVRSTGRQQPTELPSPPDRR